MMNRVFSKLYIAIIVAIISFLVLPPLSTATPLEVYPRLYATINGNVGLGLYPGLGIIESNGSVNELNRMTRAESQNSYSAFGITKNSNGDYWTSTGNALVQFDENTGQVIQSLQRTGEAFLHVVYDSFDNLYGWSNGNGFIYKIQLSSNAYTETPLFYIGMNAGGLTEMEFSNDGTLYGIDNQNKRIISIDLKSETVITVAGLPWGSYCGLAIAPDDTLFISDSISRSIIQYDKFGNKLNMFNYMSINPVLGLEFAPEMVGINWTGNRDL